MEAVDAYADHPVGVEGRQLLADRGFGTLENALHQVVGVDDGAFVVGDHHPGRDIVQRNLDAQVLRRGQSFGIDAFQQLLLHSFHVGKEARGVAGANNDGVVQLAFGDCLGKTHGVFGLAADLVEYSANHAKGGDQREPHDEQG